MASGFSTRAPSTIVTIQLTGQSEFTIPFEFLARKFVEVTLLGTQRYTLTLNTDYRFVSVNKIQVLSTIGSEYTHIELRRVTSTTDRLVTFVDGSILRAADMNLSQVQTMHVAEEARDLTADSIGTNDDGNLDARNRRIVNLADAIDGGDAVPYGQLQTMNNSAYVSAQQAEVSKLAAAASANEAHASKDAAASSESDALDYAQGAASSAQTAVDARNHALDSKTAAEAARDRAEAAAAPATEVFNRLQDVEDKVDVANGNATSAVVIAQTSLSAAQALEPTVNTLTSDVAQLESVDVAHNNRITQLESVDVAHNNRITQLEAVQSVVTYLQSNQSLGAAFFTKAGRVVTLKAFSDQGLGWPDGAALFEIPVGFRPVDHLVGTEFLTTRVTNNENGRLILNKTYLFSHNMRDHGVLFRASGSWICE